MTNFDSVSELRCYNLERLFNIQRLLFREIRYYLNDPIYDRNDIFFRLEELEIVNSIICEKTHGRKSKFK